MNAPVNLSATDKRREYWAAFAEALVEHNRANRARANGKPELVGHFARVGIEQLGYVRALRTGDWSKTRIRPLSWFREQAQQQRAEKAAREARMA